MSSPVPLNLEDLTLDRAAGTHSADAAMALLARADAQRAGEENGAVEDEEEEEEGVVQEEPSGGGSKPASRAGSMQDVSGAATAGSEAEGGALGEPAGVGPAGEGVWARRVSRVHLHHYCQAVFVLQSSAFPPHPYPF